MICVLFSSLRLAGTYFLLDVSFVLSCTRAVRTSLIAFATSFSLYAVIGLFFLLAAEVDAIHHGVEYLVVACHNTRINGGTVGCL